MADNFPAFSLEEEKKKILIKISTAGRLLCLECSRQDIWALYTLKLKLEQLQYIA